MNLVLLTGSECKPCEDATAAFKKKYAEELKTGEAEIFNMDENDKAREFWAMNELPLAPVVVVMTDSEKIVAVLDPEDLEEEAHPPSAEGVKAPV